MKIFLYGCPQEFREGAKLSDVVGVKGLRRVAGIWVNDMPIPREEFKTYVLHDGDKVRIQRITDEMGAGLFGNMPPG